MEAEGLIPGLLGDRLRRRALSWAMGRVHPVQAGSSLAGRMPLGSVDEALPHNPTIRGKRPSRAERSARQPSSPISKEVPELKVLLFMFSSSAKAVGFLF